VLKPEPAINDSNPTQAPLPEPVAADPSAEVVFGRRVTLQKDVAFLPPSHPMDRVHQTMTGSTAQSKPNSNAEVVLPVRAAGYREIRPRNSKKVA
jgi:hypothetical protein